MNESLNLEQLLQKAAPSIPETSAWPIHQLHARIVDSNRPLMRGGRLLFGVSTAWLHSLHA